MFIVYLGSIRIIKGQGGLGLLTMMIMGPNNTSDVSFGPYVRVFFFLCFLLLTNVL